MDYDNFYKLERIDIADTRIVKTKNGNDAKNGSREIEWEANNGETIERAISEALIKRFSVDDRELFFKRFTEAIRGDGSELKRIATIHSSALLALMCFWRVDEKHPLFIPLSSTRRIAFTKVFFECKNRVIEGRKPSNIDIVLVSEDGRTILLLESKFTEYLSGGKVRISEQYQKFYEALMPLWRDDLNLSKDKNGDFILSQSNPKRGKMEYLYGLKQMVSHLIGVIRGPEEGQSNSEYVETFNRASNIILGSICFNPCTSKFKKKYCQYHDFYMNHFGNRGSEIYEIIKNVLERQGLKICNGLSEKSIEINPVPITYKDIFWGNNENFLLEAVENTYFPNIP